MIIVSAIVTCIGIFAPVLIPELAVAAVVAEEGGAEIVSLLTTAIRYVDVSDPCTSLKF